MTSDSKHTVTFEFPDLFTLEVFLGWFSDGGGESDFQGSLGDSFDYGEGPPVEADYRRCFVAWGYRPESDGPPRVVFRFSD